MSAWCVLAAGKRPWVALSCRQLRGRRSVLTGCVSLFLTMACVSLVRYGRESHRELLRELTQCGRGGVLPGVIRRLVFEFPRLGCSQNKETSCGTALDGGGAGGEGDGLLFVEWAVWALGAAVSVQWPFNSCPLWNCSGIAAGSTRQPGNAESSSQRSAETSSSSRCSVLGISIQRLVP